MYEYVLIEDESKNESVFLYLLFYLRERVRQQKYLTIDDTLRFILYKKCLNRNWIAIQ